MMAFKNLKKYGHGFYIDLSGPIISYYFTSEVIIKRPKFLEVIHTKKVRISAEKRTKWTTEGLKPVSLEPDITGQSTGSNKTKTVSLNPFHSRNQDLISITG